MASVSDLSSVTVAAKRGKAPRDPKVLRALVNRVTYGFSHEEWELAQQLGHEDYVEYHLDHLAIDDAAVDEELSRLHTLSMFAWQISNQQAFHCVNELKYAHLLRAVASKRQLFERTVGFFTDHFNVCIHVGGARTLKVVDDREVVRKYAFATFPEILRASMHSAAMLHFLDNISNVAAGPQENYARELMELHTLGVDGGYSEADVKEAARCLTGWRYYKDQTKTYFGGFEFNAAAHDDGPKVVLGQPFPAGQGVGDGEQLVELLLAHPATARFLGRKLLRWFGVYDPPESLLEQVASTYAATGGDIKALLRVVLGPDAFAAMKPWKQPKVKRPLQFVAGLLRALGAPLTSVDKVEASEPPPLVDELTLLGESPFDWPTPNGFPDTAEAWGPGLLRRWSFATRLLDGTAAATATVSPDALLQRLHATGELGWGAALDQLLTGGGFSASDRAALDAHAAALPAIEWPQVAELVALAASSPSYQLY